MLHEYKKVLDTFGLKYAGDVHYNWTHYNWNGYWLVSYYSDKDFCIWAVMKGIRKECIKNAPFTVLGACEQISSEELEERISDIIKKYNQVKEEIKLEKLQKDFK